MLNLFATTNSSRVNLDLITGFLKLNSLSNSNEKLVFELKLIFSISIFLKKALKRVLYYLCLILIFYA